MNLYRLDYKRGEFGPRPVPDRIGRDYLARGYGGAVAAAHEAADSSGWPVMITRISGGGAMHTMRTVNPSQWSA